MKTTTEIITPEKAEELLKLNVRNRSINRSKVDRFVRDITHERWRTTHQSIGIAPSFLVDGQHRLIAVKESGIPVFMNVTRYDSDEEADVLMAVDITDKRTAGDMFEIARVVKKGEGKILASMARAVGLLKLAPENEGTKSLTIAELEQVIRRQRIHFDWAIASFLDFDELGAAKAPSTGQNTRFTTAFRTAFALAHELDEDRVGRFASAVFNCNPELSVTDDFNGSEIASTWLKMETSGKLRGNFVPTVYLHLRLLKSVITGEPLPKMFKFSRSIVDWYRDRLRLKRAGTVTMQETIEDEAANG